MTNSMNIARISQMNNGILHALTVLFSTICSNNICCSARRQLDAARIEQNINFLDSINIRLDVDVKERIESDAIIDKITATRLDAVQRLLVRQVRHLFHISNTQKIAQTLMLICWRQAHPSFKINFRDLRH